MAGPKFWENDPVVGAQSQSGPQPIYTAPDPEGEAKQAADARGEQRDETRLGMDVRGEVRQEGSSAIENASKLRSAYDSLQPVKDYRAAFPILMDALQAPENPTGDNALIYAYAKAMDPGSVVREGEMDMAASGSSTLESTVGRLKKELGYSDGGLPPAIRRRLKLQINQRVGQLAKIYDNQRHRFAADAEAFGIDPERVIGPHDASPYVPRYLELVEQLNGGGAVNAPTDASTYGANGVRFGMDGSDDAPFDASAYLQERYGLTPDKQDRIMGMWNANLRNPNLTVDAVKQWYAQEGMPAPADEAIATTIEAAQRGVPFAGFDVEKVRKDYLANLDAVLAQRGVDPESMSGAVGAKAAQGIMWGGLDEAGGVAGALGAAVRGENPIAGYQAERDVLRREQQRAGEAHPYVGTAAELGGGLLTGGVGLRSAGDVGQAARIAAGQGAVAGFNYGEGLGGSTVGAATGAGIGALAGAGAFKVGENIAQRAAARANGPLTEGGEVIAAADNLNSRFGTDIRPIPADVSGPGIRNISGAATKLPLSADPIVKGARAVTDEAEKAKNAIAALAGTPGTDEAAAEAALTGAKKFIATSKTKVDALYAKARQLGGSEPVDLANARQVLDRNIAELEQTPGAAPGLAELKTLRADLNRPYPVDGVKAMRTTLRDRFLGDGLRGSDLERRVGQVVDAAEDDVVTSLSAAGKADAAAAYSAASTAHAERVGVIDEVLAPIIGKKGEKSVEDVIKALDTATKTKGARLGRFMAALPKGDAATVRASLIGRLGKVSAGRQDAEGAAFSLSDFLTHWNQMSDTAKSQLFGGELRVALNDLARVAQGTKEAQRFANFSNTGGPLGLLASGGVAAGALAHPFAAASFFLSQHVGGKLLASPKFARWLAKMPGSPAAAQAHVARLSRVAAADPVIAADALGLQRQLMDAFSATPQRLAAQPNTETSTTGSESQ